MDKMGLERLRVLHQEIKSRLSVVNDRFGPPTLGRLMRSENTAVVGEWLMRSGLGLGIAAVGYLILSHDPKILPSYYESIQRLDPIKREILDNTYMSTPLLVALPGFAIWSINRLASRLLPRH